MRYKYNQVKNFYVIITTAEGHANDWMEPVLNSNNPDNLLGKVMILLAVKQRLIMVILKQHTPQQKCSW
jgi:hypothetical protein